MDALKQLDSPTVVTAFATRRPSAPAVSITVETAMADAIDSAAAAGRSTWRRWDAQSGIGAADGKVLQEDGSAVLLDQSSAMLNGVNFLGY